MKIYVIGDSISIHGPELYCDDVHFHEPIRAKRSAFIAGWLAEYKCRPGTDAF